MRLPSAEQRLFFEQATAQYQQDLTIDRPAQEYLRGRGIGPEVARQFRLGVVRNPLPGHEVFRDRLVIPYITPGGVITFSFRCLQGHNCKETVTGYSQDGKPRHCKKYRAPEGLDRTLYNVLAFKSPGEVIYITEGELDALTLTICGFPAVAVPGAQNWKPYFAKPFEEYAQVYCVADGDEAGYKLARLLSNEVKATTIRPPAGEDCNSIFVKGGEDGIRRWLGGAASA